MYQIRFSNRNSRVSTSSRSSWDKSCVELYYKQQNCKIFWIDYWNKDRETL